MNSQLAISYTVISNTFSPTTQQHTKTDKTGASGWGAQEYHKWPWECCATPNGDDWCWAWPGQWASGCHQNQHHGTWASVQWPQGHCCRDPQGVRWVQTTSILTLYNLLWLLLFKNIFETLSHWKCLIILDHTLCLDTPDPTLFSSTYQHFCQGIRSWLCICHPNSLL